MSTTNCSSSFPSITSCAACWIELLRVARRETPACELISAHAHLISPIAAMNRGKIADRRSGNSPPPGRSAHRNTRRRGLASRPWSRVQCGRESTEGSVTSLPFALCRPACNFTDVFPFQSRVVIPPHHLTNPIDNYFFDALGNACRIILFTISHSPSVEDRPHPHLLIWRQLPRQGDALAAFRGHVSLDEISVSIRSWRTSGVIHINFFNAATHSFSAGTGFSISPSYSITSGPVKFTCLSVAMNFGRSRLPWPMMTSLGNAPRS